MTPCQFDAELRAWLHKPKRGYTVYMDGEDILVFETWNRWRRPGDVPMAIRIRLSRRLLSCAHHWRDYVAFLLRDLRLRPETTRVVRQR